MASRDIAMTNTYPVDNVDTVGAAWYRPGREGESGRGGEGEKLRIEDRG
jgi:hypothetical protein